MVSTRKYREEIIQEITEQGVKGLDDPELAYLHGRASTLFEDAAEYDNHPDLKDSHAKFLYREARQKLQDMEHIRDKRTKQS